MLNTFQRLFAIFLVACFLIFSGCKKSDLHIEGSEFTRFFNVTSETPELIQQIALRIQAQQKQQNILPQIIQHEGYAIWDKSEIVKYPDGETVAYIPLVLENTRYVNSYILYRAKGNVKSMNLIRGSKYAAYGFDKGFSANQVVGDLMRLNKKVFGDSLFMLKDKRLFDLDKIKGIAAPFKIRLLTPKMQLAHLSRSSNNNSVRLSSDNSTANYSSNPEEVLPISVGCNRTISFDGCNGFTNDTGPVTCKNVTINYTPGGACTLPPLGPVIGGDGQDYASGTGGTSSGGLSPYGLPGLNVIMQDCPVGMSQPDCDNASLPVLMWVPGYVSVISVSNSLGLDANQINWLTTYPSKAAEIYNYLLPTMNDPQELVNQRAIDHLNRMTSDPAYFSFVQSHSTSSTTSQVWWQDDAWLQPHGGTSFGEWSIEYLSQNPLESFSTFKSFFMTPIIAPFSWSYSSADGTSFTDIDPTKEPEFKLELSDNYETRYPRFSNMVKNLKTFVKNNPKVLAALQRYSGFSKQQILDNLTYGQGPTIKVEEMGGRFGYYDKNQGIKTLHMRASYVRGLEQAFLQSTQEATAFLLAVTILHEFVHYGTTINNISEGIYDFGLGFERDAFNIIVNESNAGKVVVNFSAYF